MKFIFALLILSMLFIVTVSAVEMENGFQVINRTVDSNNYMNVTSNETFVVLFLREINMLNLSNVYRPYNEVTTFSADNYSMLLSWNNKSIAFDFYSVNASGYKEYFEDKNPSQLQEMQFRTSIASGYGIYEYTHNMTTYIPDQPDKLGYNLTKTNVNCFVNSSVSNYTLICGEQKISFEKAVFEQNLTVIVNESYVEIDGADLHFIDPTITINGNTNSYSWGVWYDSGLSPGSAYDGVHETGGTDETRIASDCYSSCTEHENFETFFQFSTASLSPFWDVTLVQFNWYDEHEQDPSEDTVRFYQMWQHDFLNGDTTPSTNNQAKITYEDMIDGTENVYASNQAPTENQYNLETLSSRANIRLEGDIDNHTFFYVGLRNPSGGDQNNYMDIDNEDAFSSPQLIVYYNQDFTLPSTFLTATSPPGMNSYGFSSWTKDPIRVKLNCDDFGGSGCNVTHYCIDSSNTCTPNIKYTGYINHDVEGARYVRSWGKDYAGFQGPISYFTLFIDKGKPITNLEATSGGSPYTLGSIAHQNVTIGFDCSYSLSGCSSFIYCIDSSNSCVPSTTYTSHFNISSEGTSYLRYYGVSGTSSREDIKEAKIVINRNFPESVSLRVENNTLFEDSNVLDTETKTDDFSGQLNSALANCTADIEGYCLIPLTVHSSNAGKINISNINIYYNIDRYLWNVSSLPSLTTYMTRVLSNDGYFNSSYSNSSSFTISNNSPPTIPNSLTCNDVSCVANNTFYYNMSINCSGSTDPQNDSITYSIESFYNSSWNNIGNHSSSQSLVWRFNDISPLNNVNFRCRAIDINGSNTYSSYYSPSISSTLRPTIKLEGLKIVYTNLTQRIFQFNITNYYTSAFSNITWVIESNEDSYDISSTQFNLSNQETLISAVYYNFTTGNYSLQFIASKSPYISTQTLELTI